MRGRTSRIAATRSAANAPARAGRPVRRHPGRTGAPGRPDAAPVPARHRLAPPGRRRRDRPQPSCQSSCQRRSPRLRPGGYVGWGVQESNLPRPVTRDDVQTRFVPLTCGNTPLVFHGLSARGTRCRTVRCHGVATAHPWGASRGLRRWWLSCAGRLTRDCIAGVNQDPRNPPVGERRTRGRFDGGASSDSARPPTSPG
jgi:hypothetical protein